jgi:RNA polymerase sigma-70 factor, ECF subfamily
LDSLERKACVDLAPDPKDSLNRFLADVERRAFKMARFASRNTDEAFDVVQEAMLQFLRRYTDRPHEEWKPLFYRVLQSRITDWHRRASVRKRFLAWLGRTDGEEERTDPLESVADPANPNPSDHILLQEKRMALEKAIRRLPLRQQQAFLLRAWEGMAVAQAAFVMGCSEGSIKTHYSRAVHTLRVLLEDIRS